MRIKVVASAFLLSLLPTALTNGQESVEQLKKRVTALEQRVEQLERLLAPASPSLGSTAVAEAKLEAAERTLSYTQRLFNKGYVSNIQLDADKFAVVQARKELALVTSMRMTRKGFLELNVLQAQRNLAMAHERLRHSKRLRSRGFVTEIQVKSEEFQVAKAQKLLEKAQAELKLHGPKKQEGKKKEVNKEERKKGSKKEGKAGARKGN